LVTGGGGGSFDGLAATLMRYLGTNGSDHGKRAPQPTPSLPSPVEAAGMTPGKSEGARGEERADASDDVKP
jgi:hypothetical protein